MRASVAITESVLALHEIFTHSAPDTGFILVEAKSPVRPLPSKSAVSKREADKGSKEKRRKSEGKT